MQVFCQNTWKTCKIKMDAALKSLHYLKEYTRARNGGGGGGGGGGSLESSVLVHLQDQYAI